MKNIIKAQLYGFRHKKRAVIALAGIFLFFAAVTGIHCIRSMHYAGTEYGIFYSGSYNFMSNGSGVTSMILCAAIISGFICADDFGDRTSNYEIMGGVTRRQSYFGRVIAAGVLCAVFPIIFFVSPLLIHTVFFGWGNTVTLFDAVCKAGLVYIVLIRFTAFFILLAFLFKNPYIVIITAFAESAVSSVVLISGSGSGIGVSAMSSLTGIFNINTWSVGGLLPTIPDRSNLDNRLEITSQINHSVIIPALTGREAVIIIVSSLAFAALYIFLGLAYYRKDDLR